ncbi:VOC family protein [Methylobacterium sp. JK268]
MSARLIGVRMIARDPERLASFYAAAFGCERLPPRAGAPALAALLGAERVAVQPLRLGRQAITLLAPQPPGRAYPAGAGSADTLFQHIALVVPEMDRAVARLAAAGGGAPISAGPQRLPPNTGGVSAYKFRDPEGHPLEFLAFPPGGAPPAWASRSDATCLGIDHAAIVVRDTAASLAAYGQLGFARSGGSINTGPAQERLDGVPGARVAVTALASAPEPPHVEFLDYGPGTARGGAGVADADVAATQLDLLLPDRESLARAARVLGAPAPGDLGADGAGLLWRDPDGHRLFLHTAPSPGEIP